MKKVITFAALFTALTASAMSAQAASTGTITFNGELTATTCDASVDGKGSDATITLPTIGTNQLNAPGETAGRTGFNISLTNCAGTLQTASAFFQAGSSVDQSSGHLMNMSGDATNVSLQLREEGSNEQVIEVGNASQITNASYYNVSTGSAELPYAVEYFADDATTPGTVVSNVVYSIQYQ